MRWRFLLLILLIALPLTEAATGRMKLLAVTETPYGMRGSIADLELTITLGSGRVFIDSFPLTKLDTQVSTRFAKEVACNYLKLDCSRVDFFYVIRAKSPIVGGPSAGAAITLLTIALLNNTKLREDMAITGTINSGGFIGPVGGLPAKIRAAKEAGFKIVLIPPGQMIVNESNTTIDLRKLASYLGIKIIPVSHISQVLAYFSGNTPEPLNHIKLRVDPGYYNTMFILAKHLCNRTKELLGNVSNTSTKLVEEAINLSKSAEEGLQQGHIYSAASFCFGANTKLRISILNTTLNSEDLPYLLNSLKAKIMNFKRELPSYKSLTDLEAYTVVIERLSEAESYVNLSFQNLNENDTKDAIYELAYALERFYSAKCWSKFFGVSKQMHNFSTNELEQPCISELWEARERLDYLRVYLPSEFLKGMEKDYLVAEHYRKEGSYELCLFKASKLKAQANSVLGTVGATKDILPKLVEERLKFVELTINEQIEKGHFPLLGYSYYDYASVLKDKDPTSAFIYTEYALKLSNLDMYFPQKKLRKAIVDNPLLNWFLIGISLGVLLGVTLTILSIKTHSGARGTRSGKKR